MKKTFFVFTLAVALSDACLFAQEARNALLIANGEYSSEIGKLATPIPEAEALKAVLDELGFETVIVRNADRTEIIEILDEFSTKTKNEGGIAFFHYGGHAVQHNGKNYILPVDSNISSEARLRTRAVESDEIMQSMNADANIIVLDSCRNSPFVDGNRGSMSRGLIATTEQPKNSIIIYSAESGKTASDGVFTPILTQKIAGKGKSLSDIIIETSDSVAQLTMNEQIPAVYGRLMPIYLAGEIAVTPDMFKAESPDMRLERAYANLEITSEIAGELYIDKQSYGKILLGEILSLNNIPAAHYKVEVRGEESISKLITATANETAKVLLERKKQVPTEAKPVAHKKNIFAVKRKKWSNSGEIQLLYSQSFFNLCNGEYFPAYGFEIDLCPISSRYGNPVSFAFECTSGYTFASASIGNEHFTFHEANWFCVSFGFEIMSRFSLMSSAGFAITWQTFENNTTAISYKGTSDPIFCFILYPIEMKLRLGEYVSLIGKYKFICGGNSKYNGWNIRHSLNIGIAINCWYKKEEI